MKKIPSSAWTIIIALLVLTGLFLLASSLGSVRFAEGKLLPVSGFAPSFGQGDDSSDTVSVFLAVFRVVMIIMWILLPIYVIYLLLSKEARKRLLRDIAMILPFLVLLYFLSNNIANREGDQTLLGNFGLEAAEEGVSQEAPALPEFQAPPPWVTTVATIILATVTVIAVAAIVWIIWRRTRKKEEEPLHKIEQQAREAIDLIEAGGDLRDVILRCYLQMMIALRDYRMIDRERDMTPHEFGQLLEKRGLPNEPVRQLTELFERVRYGAHNPGRDEERAAIASLSAIVSACQRYASRSR